MGLNTVFRFRLNHITLHFSSSGCSDDLGYYSNVCADRPARRFPKCNAIGIAIKNENVAFLNARLLQDLQATVSKLTTETLPTVVGMDCKMVDVSTSAVMTTQNSTDYVAIGCSNKAHPWISLKI
jgi:hypothetical protein